MRYNNYHKHTMYSNVRVLDCVVKPEEYMKRAVELGHTTYFTTEHGFCGDLFEAKTLCDKYGLKCIYGAEAYYVDDSYIKEVQTAYHIVLIAMTNKGRREINRIVSRANTEGFYYKPRIDKSDLLSLDPEGVVVTTACVASRMFKGEDWYEEFFLPMHEHFGDHMYLEVQSHNDPKQIEFNKKIVKVAEHTGCKLIHGNDSHYILPSDSKYRELFLKAKGIIHSEEDGFVLDYPDSDTIAKRYKEQGVLSSIQIAEALENTLIFDDAEELDINKEFKIPKVSEDSNKELRQIVAKAWKKERDNVPKERWKEYMQEINSEIEMIEKCGMADYFVLNYKVVDKAVNEYNGVLTRTGRGSAVSFYVNKLLGFTGVDRIASPVKLYPSRFMTDTRILESRSLPDIDLNWANVEPVLDASKDILGNDGVYYMVAWKPLQESSAFRLWCKANDMDINEYDDIAKNLDNYIDHPKWAKIIDASKVWRGVVESVAPSPCSVLLSDKRISEEIGLIKVGDVMCCNLTGYQCDQFKYLKNDYLTVSVYEIISEVYKKIGRPIDTIDELISNMDDMAWKLYEDGITCTLNQADSDFATPLVQKYKPKNLKEMASFVAGIRPSFASNLNTFLNREEYTTGVKALDEVLKESDHYILYQENIMSFLVWLGIPEKGTYDIIKKIAKKKFKHEELEELKSKLEIGWKNNVGTLDGFAESWQTVENAAGYGFNASHAVCMALDSMYCAYLKSHYPLEYYTIVLTMYGGDIERTRKLTNELDYFNIKLSPIKFGKSNAFYISSPHDRTIYKGIASIKYCNETIAGELMEVYNRHHDNFLDVLKDIKENTSVNSRQLEILITLDFFSEYGNNQMLLRTVEMYNKIADRKTLKKDKLEELGVSEFLAKKYSTKETAKQFSGVDGIGLMSELIKDIPNKRMSLREQITKELEYLGHIDSVIPELPDYYNIVVSMKTYKNASTPYVTMRQLNTGEEIRTRVKNGKAYEAQPFSIYDILMYDNLTLQEKMKKNDAGKWIPSGEFEWVLTTWEVLNDDI